MTKLTPVGMVIDQPTAASVIKAIADLGGAWVEMFDTWRRFEIRYLVLLAHTQERLLRRAPLTYMVNSDDVLRITLKSCCAQLDDVDCHWALCVEAGSPADVIVKEEILNDSITKGRA